MQGNWQTPAAPWIGGEGDQKTILAPVFRTDGTTKVVSAFLDVPSRRISTIIEAFYIADTTGAPVTSWNATWTLRALARSPSQDSPLHFLEGSAAPTYVDLPRAYELDSAIRCVEIKLQLTDYPKIGSGPGIIVEGVWALQARFEPNTPMDPQLLKHFLSRCALRPGVITG